MTPAAFKRNLTAILNAGVEGFSRLTQADEEATRLYSTACREAIATLVAIFPEKRLNPLKKGSNGIN